MAKPEPARSSSEDRRFGRCAMCKLIRLMAGGLCDECTAITAKPFESDVAEVCEACCEETSEPTTVSVGVYEATYCPGCAPDA